MPSPGTKINLKASLKSLEVGQPDVSCFQLTSQGISCFKM